METLRPSINNYAHLHNIPNVINPADCEEFLSLISISNLVGVIRNRLRDLKAKTNAVYVPKHYQRRRVRKMTHYFNQILNKMTFLLGNVYGHNLIVNGSIGETIPLSKLLYVENTRNITFNPPVMKQNPLINSNSLGDMPDDLMKNVLDVADLMGYFINFYKVFIEQHGGHIINTKA